MSDFVHGLIEQYGLLAVFLGCVAEGETAALLGGFFAHQAVFPAWQAYGAAFCGAFLGDTLFFFAGRRLLGHPRLSRLRGTPGFTRALGWIDRHPNLFVLANRYVYGLRLVGGVAAGASAIPAARFLVLNAVSAAIWAALFTTAGYVLGLGAEAAFGAALERHERLLAGLAIAVVALAVARLFVRRRARRGA
ncbi:DedA family protein [Aquibium sp. ELW1220]|uniref:DedA family protein n=1 Tax=Aquibium sp. ELW1220 TaxID=2976766 RepID=UPI0025B16A38|nr:DedA family protein [Aquibium sp. ELW1220]MDN2580725.1 DedA family protein [Aquibium sp. ELW1220]